MKIFIGLGNPGPKYKNTRHDLGFMALDLLLSSLETSGSWKKSAKFKSLVSETKLSKEKILLVKPQTFMNESGQAVQALAHFYHLKPEDLWVICDDINLPLGKMRIRKSGSAGGHKGVQSIINHLNSHNFPRFRIGIFNSQIKVRNQTQYVLKKFAPSEEKIIKSSLQKTVAAIKLALQKDLSAAMNKYN